MPLISVAISMCVLQICAWMRLCVFVDWNYTTCLSNFIRDVPDPLQSIDERTPALTRALHLIEWPPPLFTWAWLRNFRHDPHHYRSHVSLRPRLCAARAWPFCTVSALPWFCWRCWSGTECIYMCIIGEFPCSLSWHSIPNNNVVTPFTLLFNSTYASIHTWYTHVFESVLLVHCIQWYA